MRPRRVAPELDFADRDLELRRRVVLNAGDGARSGLGCLQPARLHSADDSRQAGAQRRHAPQEVPTSAKMLVHAALQVRSEAPMIRESPGVGEPRPPPVDSWTRNSLESLRSIGERGTQTPTRIVGPLCLGVSVAYLRVRRLRSGASATTGERRRRRRPRGRSTPRTSTPEPAGGRRGACPACAGPPTVTLRRRRARSGAPPSLRRHAGRG
jgi:hypothetical protein